MKIYVITEGCYSDYHIVGVATDREMAKKIQKYINGEKWSYAEIEEYDTEEWKQVVNDNRTIYFVGESEGGGLYAMPILYDYPERYKSANKITTDSHGRLEVYVLAKDEIHARKIASDLFAKYKAEKEGL